MTDNTEQFIAFPAEKRQQLENRPVPGVVNNPHHPNNQVRHPAGGNTQNPRHPAQRMAAQGISVTSPGLAPPPPTVQQPQPRMQQPMAAPVYQHQQATQGFDVPVTPNNEIEAVSFDLPSSFFYYGFREVYIKTFKGAHFSKLNRAREEESLLHMVEAVSSVLSSPGVGPGIAFALTLPDFYACLYWLRLHSFLKHAFTHQTMCRSKIHHDWVANGRKEEDGSITEILPDTLKHAETITKAKLRTKKLTAPLDLSLYPLDNPNLRLVPATMQEILEITMNDNIDRFTARIAASIQPIDQNLTLAERLPLVDDLSADDVATIRRFEDDVSDYGVDEEIFWRCKTCGHQHTDLVQLEAHSFFPSAA